GPLVPLRFVHVVAVGVLEVVDRDVVGGILDLVRDLCYLRLQHGGFGGDVPGFCSTSCIARGNDAEKRDECERNSDLYQPKFHLMRSSASSFSGDRIL